MDAHKAWDIMRQEGLFEKQGTRVSLCRFLAWLRAARKLLPKWHHLHWVTEFLAIELDMLKGTKFVTKVALKTSVVQSAMELDTTSSSVPSIDGKVLKSCCQNAVVVGMMMLDDVDNKRLLHAMTYPCLPLNDLHSLQNTECRSVDGNKAYCAKQVNGDFMKTMKDIMKTLTDAGVMAECGFSVLGNDAKQRVEGAHAVHAEDEWAGLLADISLALVAARHRRKLWSFGFPHVAVGMTNGDAIRGHQIMHRLRRMHGAWQWLKSKEGQHPMVDQLLRRSQFNNASVMQLVHVCEAEGWEFTPRLLSWVNTHVAGCFQSRVIEDCFNVAKNAKQSNGGTISEGQSAVWASWCARMY